MKSPFYLHFFLFVIKCHRAKEETQMEKEMEAYIGCLNETIQSFDLPNHFCFNEKIENGISLFQKEDCFEADFRKNGKVTWISITYDLEDTCLDIISKLSQDPWQAEDAMQYFDRLMEEKEDKPFVKTKSTR